MIDQPAFSNINFDKISYSEISDILADNSQSAKMDELKFVLSPVFNSGIEFGNVHYLRLDDVDDFNTLLSDKSYVFKYLKKYGEELSAENADDLIIVYSNKFDEKAENLYQRAYDLNWAMIADENTTDDAPLIFMYVFTEKQTAIYKVIEKNLIEMMKAEGLVPASDNEVEYGENMTEKEKMDYLQSEENSILYYVAYAVMGEKSIEAMENMIISLREYITDIKDIAYIRSIIAEKKQVPEESIYIFSFSIMGNPNMNNPDEEYPDELYDDDYINENKMSTDMSIYINRITYRLNGEEKVYDSYQNIDLCSDEASKMHLAKSVIADEEGLTEEELANLEILNVELIGNNVDDTEDEETDD